MERSGERALTPPEQAEVLARRIVEVLSQPFDLDGNHVVVGASVGIAMPEGEAVDQTVLLRNADLALYRAKQEGRGTWRFFSPDMDARAQARRALEMDLREAMSRDEFILYYQPLVNLRRQQVSGFEALLRWKHPMRGFVSPAEFIPLAEEIGLIVPIGAWVLQEATREAAGWPADEGCGGAAGRR